MRAPRMHHHVAGDDEAYANLRRGGRRVVCAISNKGTGRMPHPGKVSRRQARHSKGMHVGTDAA